MMTPHQFFKETFGLRFEHYLDGVQSACLGKPILDPFKFDAWLHEKFGNYEETGHTMQTLLIEKYGKETAEHVQKLLG